VDNELEKGKELNIDEEACGRQAKRLKERGGKGVICHKEGR